MGLIETTQNVFYVVQQVRRYAPPVVAFKEAFQTSVFEASNQRGAVKQYVPIVKLYFTRREAPLPKVPPFIGGAGQRPLPYGALPVISASMPERSAAPDDDKLRKGPSMKYRPKPRVRGRRELASSGLNILIGGAAR